ncbi:MAG: 2-oxoacid:ferredoxin oxidoreductase subunit alpha [Methanomassiliicoccales archaeon]
MRVNKLQWCIGGAQGSGVDTSANIFSRACADGGLWVYGKREYFSNIKGEHSYFVVRVSDTPVHSLLNPIDVLATFDEETIIRHFDEVVPGGAIIYDPSLATTKVEDVPTVDRRIKDEMASVYGKSPSIKDLLEHASSKGVKVIPLPYSELLRTISQRTGEKRNSVLERMVNVIAVSASFALLHYDLQALKESILKVFGGKKKVAEMNQVAADVAYEYVSRVKPAEFIYTLKKIEKKERRLLLNGNQAVALGKLAGGLRFQTYYPITPAADESTYLERYERFTQLDGDGGEGNLVIVQTEDEIAAITMAIGGALAGSRTATCTSGPGFSLMAEGLGWAGINEVPVVITNYQRAGPSTGMPTRHEQGDLKFALNGGHGDFPRIVLASGGVEEAFYDACLALNYAERYQLPVIHLLDKSIANTTLTLKEFDVSSMKIDRGLLVGDGTPFVLGEGEKYLRFRFTENGISPRVRVGTPNAIFWNTGDEHTEEGHITEDPVIRDRMMEKRMGKLDLADKEIPENEKVRYYGKDSPDLLVVSWGSTKGAILEAMDRLGSNVGFLQVRLMRPFPSEIARRRIKEAHNFCTMEMNYVGQLADLIGENTGLLPPHRIVKYNGRPITTDEAEEAMKKIIEGKGGKRMVLTHGA